MLFYTAGPRRRRGDPLAPVAGATGSLWGRPPEVPAGFLRVLPPISSCCGALNRMLGSWRAHAARDVCRSSNASAQDAIDFMYSVRRGKPHLLLLEPRRVDGHGGQAAVPRLGVLGQLVVGAQLSHARARATAPRRTLEHAKPGAARWIRVLHTSVLKPRYACCEWATAARRSPALSAARASRCRLDAFHGAGNNRFGDVSAGRPSHARLASRSRTQRWSGRAARPRTAAAG